MKTVFFGPFIGEFGWELLFWQGWVRKVCRNEFKDARKIAASFPGRQPFYPYVDEIWSLPDSFLSLKASAHAYFTDGWRGGYPGRQDSFLEERKLFGFIHGVLKPREVWVEKPLATPDIEAQAEAMLEDFKKHLPPDTVTFIPWKPNQAPDGLAFGVTLPPGVVPQSGSGGRITRRIGFEHQLLEYLNPSAEGQRQFDEMAPNASHLIALFPRYRAIRRADKNWSKEKYETLIDLLKQEFPSSPIAICGEPGGAYFADGVPPGCIDLINVDSNSRMDIQVAALKKSILALGSMSGAVLVSLAAGCPTVIWGYPPSKVRYEQENFMKSPLIYHSEIDPDVERVFECARQLAAEPVRA